MFCFDASIKVEEFCAVVVLNACSSVFCFMFGLRINLEWSCVLKPYCLLCFGHLGKKVPFRPFYCHACVKMGNYEKVNSLPGFSKIVSAAFI